MHRPWSAQSLLVMAWGLEQTETGASDACFRALVEEVKRLPLTMTTVVHEAVLGALDSILSLFNGEPERVRFAVFVLAFRKLRAPDQLRAWDTFIARGWGPNDTTCSGSPPLATQRSSGALMPGVPRPRSSTP